MVTKNTDKHTFANNLNHVLDGKGWPKRGRAARLNKLLNLGMSDKGVSKWLKGETMPTLDKFRLIAETLNASINDLLTGINNDTSEHYRIERPRYQHKVREPAPKPYQRDPEPQIDDPLISDIFSAFPKASPRSAEVLNYFTDKLAHDIELTEDEVKLLKNQIDYIVDKHRTG